MEIKNRFVFLALLLMASFGGHQKIWAGKVIDVTDKLKEAVAEPGGITRLLSNLSRSLKASEPSMINGMTVNDIDLDNFITRLNSVGGSEFASLKGVDPLTKSIVLLKQSSGHGFYIATHLRKSDVGIAVKDLKTGKTMKPTLTEGGELKNHTGIVDGKRVDSLQSRTVETYDFSTKDRQYVVSSHIWDLDGNLKEVSVIREDGMGRIREKVAAHVRQGRVEKTVDIEVIGNEAIGKTKSLPLAKDEDLLHVSFENGSNQMRVLTQLKSGRVKEHLVDLNPVNPAGKTNIIPLDPKQSR